MLILLNINAYKAIAFMRNMYVQAIICNLNAYAITMFAQ